MTYIIRKPRLKRLIGRQVLINAVMMQSRDLPRELDHLGLRLVALSDKPVHNCLLVVYFRTSDCLVWLEPSVLDKVCLAIDIDVSGVQPFIADCKVRLALGSLTGSHPSLLGRRHCQKLCVARTDAEARLSWRPVFAVVVGDVVKRLESFFVYVKRSKVFRRPTGLTR